MARNYPEQYIGAGFKPEVQNTIKLTLSFAKAVSAKENDKSANIVVSPYNALSCLSMVAKGADGATRAEMAKTLFNTDAGQLDAEVGKLTALNNEVLEANKDKVVLKTANAVWTNKKTFDLNKAYAKDLQDNMGATISAEPFDAKTVKKVNKWAGDNTDQMITKVLDNLSPDDVAVLASALYFKGDWTHKFDEKLTSDKSFTDHNGIPDQLTPTMSRTEKKEGVLKYLGGKDFDAVAMTYGKENIDYNDYSKTVMPSMRMILVRPKDPTVNARDFVAKLDSNKIPAWLEPRAFESAVGTLEMPKLKMKNKYDLIPALQDMGIKSVFDSAKANLSKMGDGQIFISKVSHDTAFETDEVGSKGAAVTVAVATRECVMAPPANIDVKVDRSFLFALQDIKTGTVLFMGAVNQPNQEMKRDPRIAVCPRF